MVMTRYDDSVTQEGLIGFQCADAHGLCISSSTPALSSEATGYISSLAHRAKALDLTNSGEFPVISIETDQYSVLIQKQGNLTLAAYKKPTGEEAQQAE